MKGPCSEETKAKISAAKRGIPLSAEHRAAIGEFFKGRPQSAELRAKRAAAQIGRVMPQATRDKIANSLRGRVGTPHTTEWAEKMSALMTGRPGTIPSAETLVKMSLASTGRRHTQATKDKLRKKSTGRKFPSPSPAIREKMSAASKGRKKSATHRANIAAAIHRREWTDAKRLVASAARSGDKCYAWKGGVTTEVLRIRRSAETRMWREKVFARDNYTCGICLRRGGVLEAHHLQPFSARPELRMEVGNGQTLCKPCHRRATTAWQQVGVGVGRRKPTPR